MAARSDQVCGFLSELVRIPSFTADGCFRAVRTVQRELRRLRLDLEVAFVSDVTDRRPIVIAWLGDRTMAPTLLLVSHLDTSPPGPGWHESPFGGRRSQGCIHGRGSVLAKSDVAAYVYALAAARDIGSVEARRTVAVAITSDEGTGGELGARWLLTHRGLRPARVISTGVTRTVAVAHCGCLQADITVRGVPSHAAFANAHSAMHRAIRLAGSLVEYGASLNARNPTNGQLSPSLTILDVDGGQPFSTAVRDVRIRVDRRLTPDENLEEVEAELRAAVAASTRSDGYEPSFDVITRAEPLRPTPVATEWAAIVQQEAELVLDEQVQVGATPLYTDARWFGQFGIPTVLFGAGPTDLVAAGVNAPNEALREADLLATTETLARLILRTTAAGGTLLGE